MNETKKRNIHIALLGLIFGCCPFALFIIEDPYRKIMATIVIVLAIFLFVLLIIDAFKKETKKLDLFEKAIRIEKILQVTGDVTEVEFTTAMNRKIRVVKIFCRKENWLQRNFSYTVVGEKKGMNNVFEVVSATKWEPPT